jgi:hypothetical protein
VPKPRRKDIPAEEADADDRTGKRLPADVAEAVEPPSEAQDVPADQLKKRATPKKPKKPKAKKAT